MSNPFSAIKSFAFFVNFISYPSSFVLTNNFSKLLPTLALGIFYFGSFYLLTFAIKFIPLSIVYATWSGIGVFLVAILSYFFYGDVLKWPAILGLCFIVVGVMLVNLFGVSRL